MLVAVLSIGALSLAVPHRADVFAETLGQILAENCLD